MSKIPLTSNYDESKVRTIRNQVEQDSGTLKRVVEQLVKKYCRDLDKAVNEINELLEDKQNLNADDLNYYVAYLPVLMYYVGNGIEELGIEGDTAKVSKQEAFNKAYLEAEEKTVQAKTSHAQQVVISEQLVESAFSRAYKQCKNKIEMANILHSSLKKVLQWKLSELEVSKYSQSNGTGFGGR